MTPLHFKLLVSIVKYTVDDSSRSKLKHSNSMKNFLQDSEIREQYFSGNVLIRI